MSSSADQRPESGSKASEVAAQPGSQSPPQPWEAWKSAHRSDDGTLPTTDPEIARLQTAEIAIAVADFECRSEVDYTARRQAILFAYEQQFVDAHAKDIVYLEQAWSEVE